VHSTLYAVHFEKEIKIRFKAGDQEEVFVRFFLNFTNAAQKAVLETPAALIDERDLTGGVP